MLQIRTAQEHAHMKENTPYIKQKKNQKTFDLHKLTAL